MVFFEKKKEPGFTQRVVWNQRIAKGAKGGTSISNKAHGRKRRIRNRENKRIGQIDQRFRPIGWGRESGRAKKKLKYRGFLELEVWETTLKKKKSEKQPVGGRNGEDRGGTKYLQQKRTEGGKKANSPLWKGPVEKGLR